MSHQVTFSNTLIKKREWPSFDWHTRYISYHHYSNCPLTEVKFYVHCQQTHFVMKVKVARLSTFLDHTSSALSIVITMKHQLSMVNWLFPDKSVRIYWKRPFLLTCNKSISLSVSLSIFPFSSTSVPPTAMLYNMCLRMYVELIGLRTIASHCFMVPLPVSRTQAKMEDPDSWKNVALGFRLLFQLLLINNLPISFTMMSIKPLTN